MILDTKTFTLSIDPETVKQIMAEFNNNGYAVDNQSAIQLDYRLSYVTEDDSRTVFHMNCFNTTFNELIEQRSITHEVFIARPDIDGTLKEDFSLEVSHNSASAHNIRYTFFRMIPVVEFAHTVSFSVTAEKVIPPLRRLLIERMANNNLEHSVETDDFEGVVKAFEAGADPDYREDYDEFGSPVFFRAVSMQNPAIVKAFLDAGADPDISAFDEGNPIEEAFSKLACNGSNAEKQEKAGQIVALLFQYGVKVPHNTGLMWKACLIQRFELVKHLEKAGASLDFLFTNCERRYKAPALHRAAGDEDDESFYDRVTPEKALPIIDFLILNGASVSIRDTEGRTALHAAVDSAYIYTSQAQFDVIQKLVVMGADVNAEDNHGNRPLHIIAKGSNRAQNQTNPEKKAAEAAVCKIVDFLVQKGADLNALNHLERSPLHICADNNNDQTALALLENGALVDMPDCGGYSALHLAAGESNIETMKVLVEKGADLYLKMPSGFTIFDMADSSVHTGDNDRLKQYLQELDEKR